VINLPKIEGLTATTGRKKNSIAQCQEIHLINKFSTPECAVFPCIALPGKLMLHLHLLKLVSSITGVVEVVF